jgi:hypothetical protein
MRKAIKADKDKHFAWYSNSSDAGRLVRGAGLDSVGLAYGKATTNGMQGSGEGCECSS